MDVLKQLTRAVSYIEENLENEIDLDFAANTACLSKDSFLRFFSYMTGISLKEYIRCRRLTLAAGELENSKLKIIDVAVKYGWDSADSFSKAFKKQHGISPKAARNPEAPLKIYPPASFHIMVKGAKMMEFRMIELKESKVYGLSKQFDGVGYRNREELRHIMWSEQCDDIPGQICTGKWNEAQSRSYDGIWYGLWNGGKYTIAREAAQVKGKGFEEHIIPRGKYAAFKTERGGLAWEEFPKLFELVFESWLKGSGYRQSSDIIIEVLHLWTDKALRNKNRYYELWIPVEKC